MSEFKAHKIEWSDEKVSRLWDFYSRTYPYNQSYFTKAVGKDILKKTEKVIGKFDNKVILDFGCGPAFFIDHMTDLKIKPKKYIGLDFSKDSVENISKKIKVEFPKEGIFVQSMPSSIDDSSVDVCFLIEVIEHLNDDYLDSTLKEIYRVLKPSGKLIITTPNNEDLDFSTNFCPECGSVYHKWQHVRVWNKTTLEKMVHFYSFSTHKIVEINFISRTSILRDLYAQVKRFIKTQNVSLYSVFTKIDLEAESK